MEVKTFAPGKKRVFSVTNGNIEGSAHLTATGGANAHEWQYTNDVVNFTGRIPASTTTAAAIDITGLQSGTKYAFFHKPIMPGISTDWEGPLYIKVI